MGVSAVYLVHHERLLFHRLTCVEQYVVVMHPLIYLNLKTQRGVSTRNAIIAFVWLLSILNLIFSNLHTNNLPIKLLTFWFYMHCSISMPLLCLYRVGEIVGPIQYLNFCSKRRSQPQPGWLPSSSKTATKVPKMWGLNTSGYNFNHLEVFDIVRACIFSKIYFAWSHHSHVCLGFKWIINFCQWQNWWVFACLLVSLLFKKMSLIWKVNVIFLCVLLFVQNTDISDALSPSSVL